MTEQNKLTGTTGPEDRYLERSLEETLGGDRAPDLAAGILTQAMAEGLVADPHRGGSQVDPGESGGSRIGRWLLVAAAAGLALGFLLGWGPGAASTRGAPIGTEVLDATGVGGIAALCHPAGAAPVELPEIGALTVAVGDSLVNGSDQPATVAVAPFGTLVLAAGTAVEVKDAAVISDNGRVVVSSVLLTVVSGGLGYSFGAMTGEANAGDQVVLENPGNQGAPVAGDEALQRQIQQQKERIQALEEALGSRRKPAKLVSDEPEAEPATEDPVLSGPIIVSAEYAETLDKIDWQRVGAAMHEMVPLMAQVLAAMEAGEEPSIELRGKIHELNGVLVGMATEARAAGVPGCGLNGTFTHPAMASNQMAAMLSAADMPLSPDQKVRLQGLVDLFSGEDRNLRAAAETHDSELQTLLEEVSYKDRFFKELDGVFSPEQLAVLRPGPVGETLMSDLFSTGVVVGPVTQPVQVRNADELVKITSGRFMQSFGMTGEQMPQVDNAIKRWASQMPAEFWMNPDDRPASRRSLTPAEVNAAARRQLALVRDIMGSGVLNEEQMAKLKEHPLILVPMARGQ